MKCGSDHGHVDNPIVGAPKDSHCPVIHSPKFDRMVKIYLCKKEKLFRAGNNRSGVSAPSSQQVVGCCWQSQLRIGLGGEGPSRGFSLGNSVPGDPGSGNARQEIPALGYIKRELLLLSDFGFARD